MSTHAAHIIPHLEGTRAIRDLLEPGVAHLRSRFTGRFGFCCRDVDTGSYVGFDMHRVYPTASTIKLVVLVAALDAVHRGRLSMTDMLRITDDVRVPGSGVLSNFTLGSEISARDTAMMMMIVSDNTATNMLIDVIGGVDAINKFAQVELALDSLMLRQSIHHEKLGTDVRSFATATPLDQMRLVERILNHQLLSPELCSEALEMLRQQQYLDQVPRYTRYSRYNGLAGSAVPDIQFGCKTGDWPGVRADVGFIEAGGTRLAYAVMCEDSADLTMSWESEPAVLNGALGWLLVRAFLGPDTSRELLLSSRHCGLTEELFREFVRGSVGTETQSRTEV